MPETPNPLPLIGWREWVRLPDLAVPSIKAKVDIGARTSSLHAFEIEEYEQDGRPWVRFELHPEQRNRSFAHCVSVPIQEHRKIRNSGGQQELRPIILTTVELLGRSWQVEVTLTQRDAMGFRMLLGRAAVRNRFWVDPGRSYLGGRRLKGTRTLGQPRIGS